MTRSRVDRVRRYEAFAALERRHGRVVLSWLATATGQPLRAIGDWLRDCEARGMFARVARGKYRLTAAGRREMQALSVAPTPESLRRRDRANALRRYTERRAAGLCITCTEPSARFARCLGCRKTKNERDGRRKRLMEAA